jgi:hypothetical protein
MYTKRKRTAGGICPVGGICPKFKSPTGIPLKTERYMKLYLEKKESCMTGFYKQMMKRIRQEWIDPRNRKWIGATSKKIISKNQDILVIRYGIS